MNIKSLKVAEAPSAAMPRNVKPMLASSVAKPFDHPDWIFEIKWDGYRAIAEIENGTVCLYSRNNLSMKERFPQGNHCNRCKNHRRNAGSSGG
jgi:ATP-dependent DNA ligase